MKALALVALLTSCTWDLSRMGNQPRCAPGKERPWLPDDRCDQLSPPDTVAFRAPTGPIVAPPRTRELILRGRDRFARFCAPCHGELGDGNSVIARDMTLRKPPSLFEPLIVGYSDRRLFETIGEGYGMMPSYAYQLPVLDRWAIVYFMRALQRSQSVGLAELPPNLRREAESWLR